MPIMTIVDLERETSSSKEHCTSHVIFEYLIFWAISVNDFTYWTPFFIRIIASAILGYIMQHNFCAVLADK